MGAPTCPGRGVLGADHGRRVPCGAAEGAIYCSLEEPYGPHAGELRCPTWWTPVRASYLGGAAFSPARPDLAVFLPNAVQREDPAAPTLTSTAAPGERRVSFDAPRNRTIRLCDGLATTWRLGFSPRPSAREDRVSLIVLRFMRSYRKSDIVMLVAELMLCEKDYVFLARPK